MTFRTFDIENAEIGGATPTLSPAPDAARHARSRRYSAVMSHRSVGGRIRGFGF